MQGAKKSSLSLGGPYFVLKNTTSAEDAPTPVGSEAHLISQVVLCGMSIEV